MISLISLNQVKDSIANTKTDIALTIFINLTQQKHVISFSGSNGLSDSVLILLGSKFSIECMDPSLDLFKVLTTSPISSRV